MLNSYGHLYVHIPFCPKVCPYCSFYKEASDRNKTAAFLDAVLAEVDRRMESMTLRPRTIFFGGGTPSALSTPQLEYLLGGLRSRLDLSRLREWTIEMNPATVSLEKARLLRDLGVNRISMGVQSWDPGLLLTLGRVHSAEQARRSFAILREAGFDNVNLDLIFGIPGQTSRQWEESLRATVALGPEHIAAYCLTYEEDTAYFERFAKGEFVQDENFDADLLETTMDILGRAGYGQYEISNHARPGRECRHNLAYWSGRDYLGLGPSAFSTVGERRWQNIPDTAAYIAAIAQKEWPVGFSETVGPRARRMERVAFGLRTRRGVRRSWLVDKEAAIREFSDLGLLETPPGRVRLSPKGRLLADSVAEELA